MARFARVVVPFCPHHVTQRGNRREPIFFEDGDQEVYCDLLAEQTRKHAVEIWAYCLMPNHVHLIAVPSTSAGLGRAMGEAHRRYTAFVNSRARWKGHLFESRYASVAMDEDHLIAAVRYVSLNPVRAGLCARARDWKWSSVQAHLAAQDDGLVIVRPVLERVRQFHDLIENNDSTARRYEEGERSLRASERTGRPLGAKEFVAGLERRLGRSLARRGSGRKPVPPAVRQPTLL
jgi:putative transposase